MDFPNILLVFHHDSTAPRFGAAPHGIPCWASEPPWPSPPLPPSRAGRLKVGNSSMFFKRGNAHLHYGYDRELLT